MSRNESMRQNGTRRLRKGLVLGIAAVGLTGGAASDADAGHGTRVRVVKKAPGKTVVVRRGARPHVVVKRARCDRVVVRTHAGAIPWWRSARRIEYACRPYYYHTRLGVCFGGGALEVALTDAAPCGYIYLDPISGRTFASVSDFKCYAANHPHRPLLLTVVTIDV